MAEVTDIDLDWTRLNSLIQEADDEIRSVYDELCSVDLRYLRPEALDGGGMKQICRTRDAMTGRPVAMALLKHAEEEEDRERGIENFLREARITAHLQHSNIVPVYDIGLNEAGEPFFTMKLLSGESLGSIIKKLARGDEGYEEMYPLPELLDIFAKLADAVAYAHSSGIIHLDLKPGNVQVCEFGEVRVYDWGLAKIVNTDCESESSILDDEALYNSCVNFLTIDGYLKGTPGYMAPEQARRGRPKDERTDVYSLGCILYAILTWRAPIQGDDVEEIIENTRKGTFVRPRKRSPERHIPKSLEAVVLKAMALDPSERYQSVERLIIDVQKYRNGFATAAEDASLPKQLQLLVRRNPKFFGLLLAGVFLIAGIVTYYTNEVLKREKEALRNQQAAEINLQRYLEASEWREKRLAAPDHYQVAAEAYNIGDYDRCLREVRVALDYDSNLLQAWELLGNLQVVRMKFKEARAAFKEADTEHARKWLGLVKRIEKNVPAAKSGIMEMTDVLDVLAVLDKQRRDTLVKKMTRLYVRNQLSVSDQIAFAKEVTNGEITGREKVNIRYQLGEEGLVLDLSRNRGSVDLRLFRGLEVVELDASLSPSQRLEGIQLLPVRKLNLRGIRGLTNLEDLVGLNLEELDLRNTQMKNISGLRGMSLKVLDIRGARADRQWLNVILNQCNVEKLYLDENLSFHEEVLRKLAEKTELVF